MPVTLTRSGLPLLREPGSGDVLGAEQFLVRGDARLVRGGVCRRHRDCSAVLRGLAQARSRPSPLDL